MVWNPSQAGSDALFQWVRGQTLYECIKGLPEAEQAEIPPDDEIRQTPSVASTGYPLGKCAGQFAQEPEVGSEP